MSAAFKAQPRPHVKKKQTTSNAPAAGTAVWREARKKVPGRPQRRDLSEGARRMADGGNKPQAAEILKTEHRHQQLRLARVDEEAARKARKIQ